MQTLQGFKHTKKNEKKNTFSGTKQINKTIHAKPQKKKNGKDLFQKNKIK